MATCSTLSEQEETLPELYNCIVNVQEYVETTEESTSSDNVQVTGSKFIL